MASTTTTAVATQGGRSSQVLARSAVKAAATDRASRSGIWVGLFAITMSFMAFTSALFVREGSLDWGHLVLPSILYLNTFVLLASSGTFELARRQITAAADGRIQSSELGKVWMLGTFVLGLGFCAGQYAAWQTLQAHGVYLATNPNSSFFYVLTFIHVLHVVGGIAALAYLLLKTMFRHGSVLRSFLENTAIYWHFMGVLWVYLLLLCRVKLQ
jgi:cytochrome c oxidase subunit 3